LLATAKKVTLDGAFGETGDQRNLANRHFIEMVEGKDRSLQRRQAIDGLVQMTGRLVLDAGGLDIEIVADAIKWPKSIRICIWLLQWMAFALEMSLGRRRGDLGESRFQRALVAILMQVLVHAQERLLAQVAGVFGVPNHTQEHVPAEFLVTAHAAIDSAR